ncbi:6910_t:CDS:2 [Scutellospora calospora]|uniref:6910_t:CDS:1 n=1 Tax=Scutellospora calospora TaxID=85575 RepID=A0ACA9KPT3_9GLOM|nr:6910_t:CDS:2 [Scutellospora calospora]
MSKNQNHRFQHTMSTIYYCIPCVEKFKCKKNNIEKEIQDREQIYKETGKISTCFKCNQEHWRCKDDRCEQCCKLRECNDIICSYCQSTDQECRRVLPKTIEEFKALEELGVTLSSGQYEPTKTGQIHEQAYFQFKDRQTVKSAKAMLKHKSMNFPKYLNGDSEQNLAYSVKEWDRCKDPKHVKKCKCDYKIKENICNICNESCIEKRKYSRWTDKDGNILLQESVGPWTFGTYRYLLPSKEFSELKDELEEKKSVEFEAIIEGNRKLLEGATLLEVFKLNIDKVRYSNSYESMKKIYQDLIIEKKKKVERFWRPVTFYFFGDGGAGKSNLVQKLFHEWYTVVRWDDIVNYLNDTPAEVEVKRKGFKPFLAKYIFMTSRRSPEESFNFGQRNKSEDEVHRDWGQFDRRLDFIIEFKGKWNDDIDLRTTELIFHRGSEEEFRNMIWDLKYDKGEYTTDELTEVVKDLNKDEDGEIVIKNNQVYWRRHFPEFKKRYLRDYPRCKELSDYKQEVLLENQSIDIQMVYMEDTEDIIESSTIKRTYEFFDSNESESSNKHRK